MKIGIISDTHIPNAAKTIPKKVFGEFKGVDLILHAGDLIDLSVIEELKKIAPVVAVSGNMDSVKVKDALKTKEIIKAGKFKIGLMHGFGTPKNLVQLVLDAFKDNKVDIIVFGHSHTPINEYINGILVFNPGTATEKYFSKFNSIGIINITDKIESKIVRI